MRKLFLFGLAMLLTLSTMAYRDFSIVLPCRKMKKQAAVRFPWSRDMRLKHSVTRMLTGVSRTCCHMCPRIGLSILMTGSLASIEDALDNKY